MSEDLVDLEVDGRALKARKGAMLIEVTDAAGIDVPRFCYHKKLSVAANCRMCLVEVEKAPKPLPACATPVMPGMKVFTQSPLAMEAQKGTMEFLLINHPLDCPICDQGGECELQDVAMGYGEGISRYTDVKRVVLDKDIGPLIATEMTRCIHCTRCVRFGQEVAGLPELGATGRGENMRIGTYIEKSVDSELSGNVIDLCPVGALTAKPSRYTARAWELLQHPSVAPHDCVGSNLYLHTLNGRVMRVVPRENEEVNEVWLSDRDRFSYTGLYSDDRLTRPMIKEAGEWRVVEWEAALDAAAKSLQSVVEAHGAEQLGTLVSPHWTLEEHYLLQSLVRGMGCGNIDHRLRQHDFSDQEIAPVMPWLGQSFAELEGIQAALLVASNVRKEQPLAALRLRKAALKGAQISFINPRLYRFHFDVTENLFAEAGELAGELAAIAAVLLEDSDKKPHLSGSVRDLLGLAKIRDAHRRVAGSLAGKERAAVLLGNSAVLNPNLNALRILGALVAELSGARFGYLAEAGNAAGAWLAGCLPHRGPAGNSTEIRGLDASAMLAEPRKAYILAGVEPEFDCGDGAAARRAMEQADKVLAVTPYANDAMKNYADILLPVATFAETSGTFVNGVGMWQSFPGAGVAPGEVRPAWKVLRVLGNLLGLEGFDYISSNDIRGELKEQCRDLVLDNGVDFTREIRTLPRPEGLVRCGDVPIYAADGLVRRAGSLQRTKDAAAAAVFICASQADELGLKDAQEVKAQQQDETVILPLVIHDSIPHGCAWIPAGPRESPFLGPLYGPVSLVRLGPS